MIPAIVDLNASEKFIIYFFFSPFIISLNLVQVQGAEEAGLVS